MSIGLVFRAKQRMPFHRQNLWKHLRRWDRRAEVDPCLFRTAAGPLVVVSPELIRAVLHNPENYVEQSAFLRTASHDPLPEHARRVVVRGLVQATSDVSRYAVPANASSLGTSGWVPTQDWGVRFVRRVVADNLAHERSAELDRCVDVFTNRKIIHDDVYGGFWRLQGVERTDLHTKVGELLLAESSERRPEQLDLVDVARSVPVSLPAVELGELFVRLVHATISFTGVALEMAVLECCRNDEMQRAAIQGDKLRPFLLELQRVLPTAWSLSRVAACDHHLGDVEVRAGDELVLATSTSHRRSDVWGPEPATLNPHRWSSGPSEAEIEAYLPFGRGKGMCPGRDIALRLIEISLHEIFRLHEVRVRRGLTTTPYVRSVLAPARGWVQFRQRESTITG